MSTVIREAVTDADIRRCGAVMRQLRPHIGEGYFLARVRRQMESGFQLAMLEEGGEVRAVAGYRFIENLASGRVLYVDDLVTDSTSQSQGHGGQLFDWLVEQARRERCDTLELDSGVQRFDAHRFYLAKRMAISSHHFRLTL